MGMREEQADCSKRGRSVQDTKGHPHKGFPRFNPQSWRTDKDTTSEKQSGRPGQMSSRHGTGSISWALPHLAPNHLQPALKPPLVWSYPEPQDS